MRSHVLWRSLHAALLLALWLIINPTIVGAAECAQITAWSNQDASAFPIDHVTRIDRSNTAGPFYFDLAGAQEKTLLATYFSMNASPSKTADQRFTNALSVMLLSFRSQAEATAMFQREVNNFNLINPVRWGYKVLAAVEGPAMAYYADQPGDQQLNYLGAHHNTIIQLTLRSASTSEDLHTLGVAQLAERLVQARALVDRKCNINNPPHIALLAEGRGSFASEFQAAMASGQLTISASDGDGIADLDWSSFKLFVAGVDKTAHALQVIDALAPFSRVRYSEQLPNNVIYTLRLDRARLMREHNFFNIAWNGEWPVELRICDRKGLCGSSSYKLPFGPFLTVQSFSDRRCSSVDPQSSIQMDVGWGNNGYPAVSNFYVVLGPTATSWPSWGPSVWSLSLTEPIDQGVLQWLGPSYGMRPVFVSAPIALGTADLQEHVQLQVGSRAAVRAGAPVELPAGTYTLAVGAVDLDQGSYRVETLDVGLCASK